MADNAKSDHPAVQAQLDRLSLLSPGRDVLGLERIAVLLDRLGNPHRSLPPVFHVAGTNGKGSSCAFLRAAIEAAGLTCHVYTSPHLVRFNERIRVAGRLIEDEALAPLLSEVLDCSKDIAPSFFEATTAAAFLAFARTPADAAIIEVGLGGRLDATNVIDKPLVCGIASIGIDHEAFLLDPSNGPAWPPLERIAWEKAGIAKAGVWLVCMAQPPEIVAAIEKAVDTAGAVLHLEGRDWQPENLDIGLAGGFQQCNAALAAEMLRVARLVDDDAIEAGLKAARWPGRLQRLNPGPLAGNRAVWVDGAHNEDAACALASAVKEWDRPVHLIAGILANKDARGIVSSFTGLPVTLTAIPVPGHASHDPAHIAEIANGLGVPADTAANAAEAFGRPSSELTLVMGSLYLVGSVLEANDQIPD